MADPRSASAPPAGIDERFTPRVTERIIRRAVRLHERSTDALSIGEVRQTLAALGVAPEAAERAAAEVRSDLQHVWRIRGPGQVLLHVALFLAASWPGAALVLFHRDTPVPWLALPLGILMLFAILRWHVREFARMLRTRHMTDAVSE